MLFGRTVPKHRAAYVPHVRGRVGIAQDWLLLVEHSRCHVVHPVDIWSLAHHSSKNSIPLLCAVWLMSRSVTTRYCDNQSCKAALLFIGSSASCAAQRSAAHRPVVPPNDPLLIGRLCCSTIRGSLASLPAQHPTTHQAVCPVHPIYYLTTICLREATSTLSLSSRLWHHEDLREQLERHVVGHDCNR